MLLFDIWQFVILLTINNANEKFEVKALTQNFYRHGNKTRLLSVWSLKKSLYIVKSDPIYEVWSGLIRLTMTSSIKNNFPKKKKKSTKFNLLCEFSLFLIHSNGNFQIFQKLVCRMILECYCDHSFLFQISPFSAKNSKIVKVNNFSTFSEFRAKNGETQNCNSKTILQTIFWNIFKLSIIRVGQK